VTSIRGEDGREDGREDGGGDGGGGGTSASFFAEHDAVRKRAAANRMSQPFRFIPHPRRIA